MSERADWMVSLHGGHSSEFCDHAQSLLVDILEAAVAAGYHTFGVSEHAPRHEERFLYPEEKAMGWNLEKIHHDFARYTQAIQSHAAAFAGRLQVLRGLEMEVVPTAKYVELMTAFRHTALEGGAPAFDYAVGSVHFVDEIQIDGAPEGYARAVEACGGVEAMAIRYYESVAEMAYALRPEVVGHLDLIKRNLHLAGFGDASLETPRIQKAAESALEAVRETGGILDLNTAGWRKGLGEPYPAPWLIRKAEAMGVGFCIGDDSHKIADVGAGTAEARDYLLQNGVETVTILTRDGDFPKGGIIKRKALLR